MLDVVKADRIIRCLLIDRDDEIGARLENVLAHFHRLIPVRVSVATLAHRIQIHTRRLAVVSYGGSHRDNGGLHCVLCPRSCWRLSKSRRRGHNKC